MENSNRQRYISDAILLLTAFLWGIGFIPQKVVSADLSAFCFNALRYLIAGVVVLIFAKGKLPLHGTNLKNTLLAGLILFAAANAQQIGMRYTTVGNTSFITAIYIVLVPFMAALLFKKKVGKRCYFAAFLALVGLYLLTTSGKSLDAISMGDWIVLLGSIFWSLHIFVVKRGAESDNPIGFSAGQFLVCSFLNMICWLVSGNSQISAVIQYKWWIIFSGVVVNGLAYTLQVVGEKHTSESEGAIIMGMESVFGAIFGALILHESLAPIQITGAVLIMSAVLIAVKE